MSHFTTFVSLGNPGDHYNLEAWAESLIWDKMEPFCESTDGPDYLEFQDSTEEVREGYSGAIDCIKFPNGSVVPHYCTDAFVIKDGMVYQKNAGILKHEKRTKRPKR